MTGAVSGSVPLLARACVRPCPGPRVGGPGPCPCPGPCCCWPGSVSVHFYIALQGPYIALQGPCIALQRLYKLHKGFIIIHLFINHSLFIMVKAYKGL